MQQYHVIAKRIANPRQRVDVLVRGVGEKLLADPVTGLQRPGRFVDQPVHAIAGDNDARLTARPDPPGNCAIGQTRDLVRDVSETAVEPAKPTGSSNVSLVANSSFVLSRSGSSGSSPSTSSLSPARRRGRISVRRQSPTGQDLPAPWSVRTRITWQGTGRDELGPRFHRKPFPIPLDVAEKAYG